MGEQASFDSMAAGFRVFDDVTYVATHTSAKLFAGVACRISPPQRFGGGGRESNPPTTLRAVRRF